MANTIQLKRSGTASKVPLTTDLALGELAVNTFDGKLYLKKNDGVDAIVEIGAGGGGGGGTTLPTGTVQMYAGFSAPSGWLLCEGQAVSRTTYGTLWDLFRNGTSSSPYGNGDGSTTFNLPDLRRRHVIGKGTSDSIGNNEGVAEGSRLLTHNHTVPSHYHAMTGAGSTLAVDISHTHLASTVTGTISTENLNHAHSGTVTGGGTHTHIVPGSTSSTYNANGDFFRVNAGTADYTTSTSGSHSHGVTIDTSTALTTHTHTWSNGSAAGQTLGSTSKSVSGSIGNVSTGVAGNSTMTSGDYTQPFVVMNYIIKY